MSNAKLKVTNEQIWNLLVKMDSRLTNHEIEMNIRFDEHDQRFDRIDQKMSTMDERIIEVQDAFVGLNNKFDYEFVALSDRV